MIFPLLIALSLGMAADSGPGRFQSSYDELIVTAREHWEAGDLDAAAGAIGRALAADDQRFEAHALAALVAHDRESTGRALEHLDAALDRAPRERRVEVERMREQVVADAASRHRQRGRSALADRLFARAGEELEQAWRLEPLNPADGLDAAHAYLRVGLLRRGIPLLQQLRLEPDPEIASRAATLLEPYADEVEVLIEELLGQATACIAERRDRQAIALTDEIVQLSPQRWQSHLAAARALASAYQEPLAIAALAEAIRWGVPDSGLLIEDHVFDPLRDRPAFLDLLAAAYGPAAVDRSRELHHEAWEIPGFCYVGTNVQGRHEYVHFATNLTFVLVPETTASIGSPVGERDRDTDELQHLVTVSPFLIAKHEVTQGCWHRQMGARQWRFMGTNLPVEGITWAEAQSFCARFGFDLPTEAQWEIACRAGSSGGFAGDVEQVVLAWPHTERSIQPVGTRAPNAWGLHDVHGNVWEWCRDWYAAYPREPTRDYAGPETGRAHVFRGGSWDDSLRECRSANRAHQRRHLRPVSIGVRPVFELDRRGLSAANRSR